MAAAAEKIAVSIDRVLLQHAEHLRKSTGESRSALVSRALRRLLAEEERARRVSEYVEAYRQTPETPGETRDARSLARRSLRSLPWDDE